MLKGMDVKYLKHFFQFAKKYKRTAIIGIAMLPLSIATSLLFPWLIIQVIDVYLSQGNIDGLLQHIVYLVIVLIASYISIRLMPITLEKQGNTPSQICVLYWYLACLNFRAVISITRLSVLPCHV